MNHCLNIDPTHHVPTNIPGDTVITSKSNFDYLLVTAQAKQVDSKLWIHSKGSIFSPQYNFQRPSFAMVSILISMKDVHIGFIIVRGC